MWKRVHRNGEKNLPWAFKDCTRLLHISLLPRDIIIFKCTKIQYHIWYWILVHLKMMYTVPEVWCVTDVTFISWLGLFFFFFYPSCPTAQKIKMGKKWKKKTPWDIIILHIYTKNYDQMMYSSWEMVCNRQTDGQMEKVI